MGSRNIFVSSIVALSVVIAQDGRAEQASPCAGMECSGHGLCVVIEGQGVCECEEGYVNELEHRRTCVPEQREQETPSTPSPETQAATPSPTPFGEPDPCEGVTCSGHGTCQVLRGSPVCQCDAYFMHPQHLPVEQRFTECVRRDDEPTVGAEDVWDSSTRQRRDRDQISGAAQRPSGFFIEVDLSIATPIFTEYIGELISPDSLWLSPHFIFGGQLRRFSFGLQTTIAVSNYLEEDSTDPDFSYSTAFTMLGVRLGPRLDGEVWITRRAAIFLYGGIDVLIQRAISEESMVEETDTATSKGTGVSLDFGFGGRIYVMHQLSIGLTIGSLVDITFWGREVDGEPVAEDVTERSVSWSLYGALMFRFIADREDD